MISSNHRPLLLKGHCAGISLIQQDDIETIARWNQNLEFTALLGTPGEAQTIEMRQETFKQSSRIREESAEFSVIDLSAGRLVGFGGLFDITRALASTMFIGIGDPDKRRQGLGSEACRLLCEYGFYFRSLHSIKVEVHAYNAAALRVYERLGFKTVGRLRGVNLLNGERYDEVIMDLVREEFACKHLSAFRHLEAAS